MTPEEKANEFEAIIQKALDAGFAINSLCGQAEGKLKPISDFETLFKFAELLTSREEKLDDTESIVEKIDQLRSDIDFLKAEFERLTKKRDALRLRAKRMSEALERIRKELSVIETVDLMPAEQRVLKHCQEALAEWNGGK